MGSTAPYLGQFRYNSEKFEFRVIALEFIRGKSLKMEAVCCAPNLPHPNNKEQLFRYSTTDFNIPDEALKVALAILSSVIKKAHLAKKPLYKLSVREGKVYYIFGV
jgi:hypothetical protein